MINLFPRIQPYEPRPWWAGFAAFDAKTHTYLLAPIGLNWIVAAGLVVAHSLINPKFFISVFAHREELVRIHSLNQQNYKQKAELRDLRAHRKSLEVRVKQLEQILTDTVHEKHPYIRPFGDQ